MLAAFSEQSPLRMMDDGDTPFVFSSWLHSNKRSEGGRSRTYFNYWHGLIERLLARHDTNVMVTTDPDSPGYISGWICYSMVGDIVVVHYVYIKHGFRKLGWARMLADAVGLNASSRVIYTTTNKKARKLAGKFAQAEYVELERWLND